MMLRTSPVITGSTLGPRCGQPVKLYDKPGRDDFAEVCWRPAGHPQGRHTSRWAYLRDLRRNTQRNYRGERARRQELAA